MPQHPHSAAGGSGGDCKEKADWDKNTSLKRTLEFLSPHRPTLLTNVQFDFPNKIYYSIQNGGPCRCNEKSGPWKWSNALVYSWLLLLAFLCSHECTRFTSQGQNRLQRPLRHRAGGEDQTQDEDHLWQPKPHLGWEVLLVSAFHQSDLSLPPA